MDSLFFGFSLGFAEMKHTNTSKYLASKDLIRLGILSKNSIDRHDLQGCLTIQVVGFQMIVFLTTLLADGLYVMVEIGNITIPASIREIPQYFTNSDDIISILECFQSWCSPSPQPQPSFKRKRLDQRSDALIPAIDDYTCLFFITLPFSLISLLFDYITLIQSFLCEKEK
jgi:hypothetical protein